MYATDMTLEGYDAKLMTRALEILDSVSPLNGMVTIHPDPEALRLLIKAEMIWEDQDGDVFEDWRRGEWARSGGDVRQLAGILGLDVVITL